MSHLVTPNHGQCDKLYRDKGLRGHPRSSTKLAIFLDGRYLNSADADFVQLVSSDIGYYLQTTNCDGVLVFPPVDSYHRFLLHKTIEEDFPHLTSFSIGEGDDRRTVVCPEKILLRAFQMEQHAEAVTKILLSKENKKGRGRARIFKDETQVGRQSHGTRSEDDWDEEPAWFSNMRRKDGRPRSAGHGRSSRRNHDYLMEGVSGERPGGESPSAMRVNDGPKRPSSAREDRSEALQSASALGITRTRGRGRRPDAQIYVPRARRLQQEQEINPEPGIKADNEGNALPISTVADQASVPPRPVGHHGNRRASSEHYVPRHRRQQEKEERTKDFPNDSPKERLQQVDQLHIRRQSNEEGESLRRKDKSKERRRSKEDGQQKTRQHSKSPRQPHPRPLDSSTASIQETNQTRKQKRLRSSERSEERKSHKTKHKDKHKDREKPRSKEKNKQKDQEIVQGERNKTDMHLISQTVVSANREESIDLHENAMAMNSPLLTQGAANSPTQGNKLDNENEQLCDAHLLTQEEDIQTACSWEMAVREADRELVFEEYAKQPLNCNHNFQNSIEVYHGIDMSEKLLMENVDQVTKKQVLTTETPVEMSVVSGFGSVIEMSSQQDTRNLLQDCDKCEDDNNDVGAQSKECYYDTSSQLNISRLTVEQSTCNDPPLEQRLPQTTSQLPMSDSTQECSSNDFIDPLKTNVVDFIAEQTQASKTLIDNLQHGNQDLQTQDELAKVESSALESMHSSTDETTDNENLRGILSEDTNICNVDKMEVCNCESVKLSDLDSNVNASHVTEIDTNNVTESCSLPSCPPVQNENVSQGGDLNCSLALDKDVDRDLNCSPALDKDAARDLNCSPALDKDAARDLKCSPALGKDAARDLNCSPALAKDEVRSTRDISKVDNTDLSVAEESCERIEPGDLTQTLKCTADGPSDDSSLSASTGDPSLAPTLNEHDLDCTARQPSKEDQIAMETEEDSWDTLFDEKGNALDSKLMDELTTAVGKVKVQKPQFDYYNYQPKDPDIDDETFGHLIEIYDFSSDLLTRDLIMAFKEFQDRGFDIKWVDDTHAIGVFSSTIAAHAALGLRHPLIKVRPISQATRPTKMKAKKAAEFLTPYRPRPETTAAVARNLVTGALGLTSRIPREKRDEERRKLREAKEKKRSAAKQKHEAWEGFGKCAMDNA